MADDTPSLDHPRGEKGDMDARLDHDDAASAARIRRRVDLRLLPALGLMYGISLMDRKNVSNAFIAGMGHELHLTEGYGYSIITLSFFISYVVFQALMTVLCRKIGPRLFRKLHSTVTANVNHRSLTRHAHPVPSICIAWGAVIVGFGFVQNWRVQIPLRLLLGILEAGFFPGYVFVSLGPNAGR